MQSIVSQRVLGDGFFSADAVVAVMDPNVVFPPENSTNDPIYVTEIEGKITSAEVVNDHASKAGFNCLPLLLPPYPWGGATQVPVSQG
jgi:hypothetical protein